MLAESQLVPVFLDQALVVAVDGLVAEAVVLLNAEASDAGWVSGVAEERRIRYPGRAAAVEAAEKGYLTADLANCSPDLLVFGYSRHNQLVLVEVGPEESVVHLVHLAIVLVVR